MKNKPLIILSIVILSILSIGLTVFMIFMLNGNARFRNFAMFQTVSKNLIYEKSYEKDFSSIDFMVGSGNISIKEAEDSQVKVLIYAENKENVEVTSNDNRLKIDVKDEKCNFICFKKIISKVEVYLPSNFSGLVKIENQYGDTNISQFLDANFDIVQKYGDVSINHGNQVNIENDYGDIDIDKAINADIKCAAGDVKVGTVGQIKVENNYGDIHIRRVENSLDITEDCGDIEIGEVTLDKNSTIKNSYGDIEIGFTNEIYINASTDLGDVSVRQNYPKSDVTLNIKNSCGDIEVNN